MRRIGVKYCGGCRAQYDRKAGFEMFRESLSDGAAEFVQAEGGGRYDALLVLCGCPSRCAGISDYHAEEIVFVDSKEGMGCLLKEFT